MSVYAYDFAVRPGVGLLYIVAALFQFTQYIRQDAGLGHNALGEGTPGKLGCVWTFTGTRVPVSALFENLESGATVEQFLEWFPGVEEWKVRAVLEHEAKALKVPEQP